MMQIKIILLSIIFCCNEEPVEARNETPAPDEGSGDGVRWALEWE
jgi:hypothetical protein